MNYKINCEAVLIWIESNIYETIMQHVADQKILFKNDPNVEVNAKVTVNYYGIRNFESESQSKLFIFIIGKPLDETIMKNAFIYQAYTETFVSKPSADKMND